MGHPAEVKRREPIGTIQAMAAYRAPEHIRAVGIKFFIAPTQVGSERERAGPFPSRSGPIHSCVGKCINKAADFEDIPGHESPNLAVAEAVQTGKILPGSRSRNRVMSNPGLKIKTQQYVCVCVIIHFTCPLFSVPPHPPLSPSPSPPGAPSLPHAIVCRYLCSILCRFFLLLTVWDQLSLHTQTHVHAPFIFFHCPIPQRGSHEVTVIGRPHRHNWHSSYRI